MLPQKLIIGVLLAALLAAVALPSRADTVPSAVYMVSLGGQVINVTGPGTFTLNSSVGVATVTLSYSDGEAAVSTAGNGTAPGVSAQGIVSFYFEAVGLKSEPVPILITGNGTTSVMGFSGSSSGIFGGTSGLFETPFGELGACSSGPVNFCNVPGSFSSTLTGNVVPGTVYSVSVVLGGSTVDGGGSWSASIDPQVQIDPSFADANDFTLEFSPNPPGTGPTGVPEPASASLLLVGCLPLAVMFRFRFARTGRVS